jgi:hypothetical protein
MKYYCFVVVNGEKKYFTSSQLKEANSAAQSEADRIGEPVKRRDYSGPGYSISYPKV